MKIELTVSEDYCPSWDLFCGVREFIQNAKDASKAGCTFDVSYDDSLNTLNIRTVGAVLSHKTLLLGESTKRGRSDMLGEQGEGYKIGSLVLVRMGKGVKIRTGSELWIPTIQFSKKFSAKVLTFDISSNRKNVDEIVVSISGITPSEWESIRWKFLFISDTDSVTQVPSGGVILNGKGNLFVEGIWVCQENGLRHSYDFRASDARLDRDRRLMSSFDARTLAARSWEYLYTEKQDRFGDLVDNMLADNASDVEHFRYDWCVGMNARRQVAKRFQDKFGEKAVAVRSESEVRELEFHGRNAHVVTSESLRAILEKEIGTVETVRKELAEEIQKEDDVTSLSASESKNFLMALEFVSKALSLPTLKRSSSLNVKIASFKSDSIMGMRKGNVIYLSKNTLSSFKEALKTLVEEVAHEFGDDGTHDHVEVMHEIYASGVDILMSSK